MPTNLDLRDAPDMRAERIKKLEADNERLRQALLWIDHYEPELVAAAETKFGVKLAAVETKLKERPDAPRSDHHTK